jgi:hypothetical protein
MKTTRFATLALLALIAGGAAGCTVYTEAPPPPPPVAAEVEVSGGAVDVGIFYEGLGSSGEWIERPGYGRVWYPTVVRAGWRPYLYGRWVSSDYGWTWVSEEEFGWATYHYGRWYRDDEVGWVWVPGTEWGPAWVSFQQGGGYIGWAPLPPGVAFRAGIGIELGGVAIEAGAYSFVEERAFLHPQIATVIVAPARNVTIINNTTNITNYTVVNNKIVNQSVSVQHVEQVTGQRVQRYQVATASTKGATSIQGNQVSIYKPAAPAKAQTNGASQAGAGRAKQTGAAGQARRGNQQSGQGQGAGASGGQTSQAAAGQNRSTQNGGGTQQPAGANGGSANAAEMSRRHQAEKEQLAAKHAAERNQLQATHQQELAAAKSANDNAAELKRKHDAEVKAQQQQHQKEQAALEARHKQEKSHHPPR